MKVNRFTRVIYLLTILQSGKCGNINELARTLNVSRRTVYRDLRTLQNVGIPCRFDHGEKCYSIPSDFFMPPLPLTAREAFGLLLIVEEAVSCMASPFINYAIKAATKVQSCLSPEIRQYCREALGKVSIVTARQMPEHRIDNIFDSLHNAILNKDILRINYRSPMNNRMIKTLLNPYHLILNGQRWHVIGKSSFHDRTANFELNRIDRVNRTGKKFIEEDSFEISEYLGRAWSLVPEGKLYTVKLKLSKDIVPELTSIQWHSTQEVKLQEDGSAIMEFRVDGINEIAWWIIGYGDKIQVLMPEALREKVLSIVRNLSSIAQDKSKSGQVTKAKAKAAIVSIQGRILGSEKQQSRK